jgi:two-component system, sensor histidine kinase and response regulator
VEGELHPCVRFSDGFPEADPGSEGMEKGMGITVKPLQGLSCHVLLVEDEPTVQAVEKAMLEHSGCRVDVAVNGRQAVESFSRQRYDIIFMDCQMPEMNGFEAASLIREMEAGKRTGEAAGRIPIVALTGYDCEEMRENCLAKEMDDYLGKPFTMSGIRAILERWGDRRDAVSPEAKGNEGSPGVDGDRSPQEGAGRGEEPSAIDEKAIDLIASLAPSGSEGLVKGVIDLYLESSATLMAGIGAAVEAKDAVSLNRSAHALKSASANLGAVTFAGICRELEVMGRNNALEEMGARMAALTLEYPRVREALERRANRVP